MYMDLMAFAVCSGSATSRVFGPQEGDPSKSQDIPLGAYYKAETQR